MPRSRISVLLLLAAIVAVALNQRPAVVAVAPVLGDLRADTGLSSAMAGLLTTLPVLCFGAFAPIAPRLARRIGLETAVALSLVLLAAGIALRLLSPVALLFAGSLLAGAAIALANVLLPAYVKREFRRPGAVMGMYSAALNVGAAAGAALTIPVAGALGVDWRWALGSWLVLALAALALWLPVAGTGHAHRTSRAAARGSRAPGRCCASRWPGRSRPSSGCRACSSTRSPPGCPPCSPTPACRSARAACSWGWPTWWAPRAHCWPRPRPGGCAPSARWSSSSGWPT